jgi:outer membrane immunogenic protein
MKKLLVAGIAAAAFFGASALAADMPTKGPAYQSPQPMFNWTGFYIGGNAGYGWGGSRERDPATGLAVAVIHAHGPAAGGQFGFNYQMGHVVVGVQGDLDWININGTDPACAGGTLTCHGHNVWYDTLVGRLGYAVDRVLYFVKGGAAWLHEEFQQTANIGVICVVPCRGSATYTGWTMGAGVEYAVAPNWSVAVDYAYAQFPKMLITSTNGVTINTVDIVHHANLVKFSLNYKFGGDPWGKSPVVAKY